MYLIYKYVCDQEIVYIGKTRRDLKHRIYEHSKELKFLKYHADIYYFVCHSRLEMDLFERILIAKYRPVLNVLDNQASDLRYIDHNEPVWHKYTGRESFGDSKIKPYISDQDLIIYQEILKLEQQDQVWQNFESLLEHWFDVYINLGFDYISKSQIRYFWDLDLYSLPESIIIDDHTYSCYIRAKKLGLDYECVIDTKALFILLESGRQASLDARMAVTTARLELEIKLN